MKKGLKMEKSYDKLLARLFQILLKLNSGERFTVEELAKEFNVSKRTVQRDMNERFSSLDIKKVSGYYFLEPHSMGHLSLEDIKTFAAVSGIKTLYPAMTRGLLEDILKDPVGSVYAVKHYGHENLERQADGFETLGKAILGRQKVFFWYKNKQRAVNPYKLINKNGVWYLAAEENGNPKNYAFSKIINLNISDERFEPNKELLSTIEKNELEWFSQNAIEVTLRVKAAVSEYFLRRKLIPNQQIIEQTAEYLTIKGKASYEDEILGTVKYWLPHVSIVSPPHLQQKLNDVLKGYLDEYDSDAINIFLNKVRLEKGMPFDIKVPSSSLKVAMTETEIGDGTIHDNVEDMLRDLKKDDI